MIICTFFYRATYLLSTTAGSKQPGEIRVIMNVESTPDLYLVRTSCLKQYCHDLHGLEGVACYTQGDGGKT